MSEAFALEDPLVTIAAFDALGCGMALADAYLGVALRG